MGTAPTCPPQWVIVNEVYHKGDAFVKGYGATKGKTDANFTPNAYKQPVNDILTQNTENTTHNNLRFELPVVFPWRGGALPIEWFRVKHVVDRETTNSSVTTGVRSFIYNRISGRTLHRYYNYELDETYLGRPWHITLTLDRPGTYRYYVRVRQSPANWVGSSQPLPGDWQSSGSDQITRTIDSTYNTHWSQNCDEDNELALRISVRQPAFWVQQSSRKRAFVEWLSSFINVPYEWGGRWYGGRADDKPQRSDANLVSQDSRIHYPGDAGYEGYGVDCSGLVYAAAKLAGYNIPYRFACRDLLSDTSITSEVRLGDIEEGDLLVYRSIRGSHVVVVYRVHRKLVADGVCKVDLDIIHAVGYTNNGTNDRGERTMIESVSISGNADSDMVVDGITNITGTPLASYRVRRLR